MSPGKRMYRTNAVPLTIVIGVAAILIIGGLMVWRADAKVNKVALASSARPVSSVYGLHTKFREARSYAGTLLPWVEAEVGPSSFQPMLTRSLVRPGANVKKRQCLPRSTVVIRGL